MYLEKYSTLMQKLENDELEQNNVGDELYVQLFALYLYEDELVNAKHLLKRIPPSLKVNNKELQHLQLLLRALLNNNSAEFFKNINYNWSGSIKGVMDDLKVKIRNDVFTLVGQAYTSIFEQQLIQITQISRDELREACLALGWAYEGDGIQTLVLPKKPAKPPRPTASSEDQLFKLTEFVSFLEN